MASTLLLGLLFATFACSSRSLDLSYQLLLVIPLQEHPDPARPRLEAESLAWSFSNEAESAPPSLTLRLMHRDSPLSPLANPHATPQQLLLARLNRDASRAVALSLRAKAKLAASQGAVNGELATAVDDMMAMSTKASLAHRASGGFTGPLVSGYKQGSGEYFIRLGVGTPAIQTFMVIDTGSDVMWIQCEPCTDCYEQSGPVFDPSSSSSLRRLACTSPICAMLDMHGCGKERKYKHCLYQVAYGDGSFTEGEFVMEELSFEGQRVRVAMGCGHDNEGLFAGAGGLFGLGGGGLSFPTQMGRRYRREFSYCLKDREREGYSTLIFGGGGGGGIAYTPLLRNANVETYYYVAMNGISVGGEMLTIPAEAFKIDVRGAGGVIIDSGTSVTRLVEVAYGPLRSAFKAAIAQNLRFSGGFSLFDTCYDASGRASVKLPTISLHFAGGVELALPASNYFIPVDSQGTHCLAFASTPGDLSIIGNIQQQGFRVYVDTASSRLGFAPNQC